MGYYFKLKTDQTEDTALIEEALKNEVVRKMFNMLSEQRQYLVIDILVKLLADELKEQKITDL